LRLKCRISVGKKILDGGDSVYVEAIFVAEGIQSSRITEEIWKCCRIAANCDMVYC